MPGLGRLRQPDDELPAPASEHVVATTNREITWLNEGPTTLGNQLGVSGPRLYSCRSGEPLSERLLPELGG